MKKVIIYKKVLLKDEAMVVFKFKRYEQDDDKNLKFVERNTIDVKTDKKDEAEKTFRNILTHQHGDLTFCEWK